MTRCLALLALLLAACSTGLHALAGGDDTSISVGGPGETGLGSPLDSGDTADSATDTAADTAVTGDHAPVADAGADQTGNVGDVIQLDGSGSYDPDGDVLTWQWTFDSVPQGSTATLLNADQSDPRFYADVSGTFTVRLTVSDGQLSASDTADVVIAVPNTPPVADAGPDQTVSAGDTVQLNGNASYDPEGQPLTWQWQIVTRPAGSTTVLSDDQSMMPRFTADQAGTYTVQLVVNDGTFDSAPDTMLVTAQSTDSGTCLSCQAMARRALRERLSMGNAASGPGLVLLPLLVLFWQRKRRD